MISFIHLHNFMSWEDQRFDFTNGVNIICGVSDKGKSAIIKAEEFVRTNKPLGFEFASDWIKKKNKKGGFILTGDCIVTIGLTDGTEVSRIVGKNVNEYRISTLEEPLKALNKQVPKEVSDLLNMSDINIQDQGDPYFLFNLSPPEIGRRLNQVASLSDIDKSFKNAESTIRSLNADIKSFKSSIDQYTYDEKQLSWVEQADIDLKKVEAISSKLSSVRSKEQALRNTRDRAVDLEEKLKQLPNINKLRSALQKAIDLKNKIEAKQKKFNDLENAEESILDYNKELDEIKKILKAKRLIDQANKIKLKIDTLNSKINPLTDLEEKATDLKKELELATKEYNDVAKEYKKMKPDTCPLCKRSGWKDK